MSGRDDNQGSTYDHEASTEGSTGNSRQVEVGGNLRSPPLENASSQAGTSIQNDDKAPYDVDAPIFANAFQGYLKEQSAPSTSQPRVPIALSSATLEPIAHEAPQITPLASPNDIPFLKQIDLEPARKEGVYGYTPPRGPSGCKFLIYIKHTSPLAVKILSSLNRSGTTPFWIDFGVTKVPCVPHKFYLDSNHTNSEWGRDREVLVGLVPELEGRREVDVRLYVESERGGSEFNLQIGKFKLDETVPLRRYVEVEWRGRSLIKFLEMEKPSTRDVLVPKMFMVSELTRDLSFHHISNVPQPSDTSQKNSSEGLKRRLEDIKSADMESSPSSATSTPIPTPSLRPAKSRRKSSVSRNLRITTPGRPLRQEYVTISFTDPIPSTFGIASLRSWAPAELHCQRRLMAFTCVTDYDNISGTFTCRPIPNLASSPPRSFVVSCIYIVPDASQLRNTCIITSYDFINLIKWMINSPAWFVVEERNRVRRNLEAFGPVTLHKDGRQGVWDTFKQVTEYVDPKPWNILKDFKVFKWEIIEGMMRDIIKKYSVLIPEGHPFNAPVEREIEEEMENAELDLLRDMALEQEPMVGGEEARLDSAWEEGRDERGSGSACNDGEAFGESYFGGVSNTGGMGFTFRPPGDAFMESSVQSTMTSQWYHQETQVGPDSGAAGDVFPRLEQGNLNNPRLSMLEQETTNFQTFYDSGGQQTAGWEGAGVQREVFDIRRQQPRLQIQSLNRQDLSASVNEDSTLQNGRPGYAHQSQTEGGGHDLIQARHYYLAEDNPEDSESSSLLDNSYFEGVHDSSHSSH